MEYKIVKVNDFTTLYIKIHNNFSSAGSSQQDDYWCDMDLKVESKYFNYQLSGENITTWELDKIRSLIMDCINDKVEADEEFETLEPYFRFVISKSSEYGPKFQMRLYFEVDGAFDFCEFYSIGFDTKEELKSLYDALEY